MTPTPGITEAQLGHYTHYTIETALPAALEAARKELAETDTANIHNRQAMADAAIRLSLVLRSLAAAVEKTASEPTAHEPEFTTQDGRAQQFLRALLHLVRATGTDPDATTVTITHHRQAAGQPHQDTWTGFADGLAERLAEATDLDEGLRRALWEEQEARRRLQAEHDAALDLAAAATGWRLTTGHGDAAYGLSVQSHPTLGRYAVIEGRSYALRGLRAYTPDGWQFLQLLDREQVFCWPDAHTALTHARSLLTDPPDGITRRIAPTQTLQDDRSQDGGEPR